MKVHRFIGDFDLTQTRLVITEPSLVHQWGRVLRLRVGKRVVLCDGKGQEAEGELKAIDKQTATVQLESVRANDTEPAIHLTLYLALIKRENFELAVQKATEVGVTEIVPITTARTIKSTLNLERLRAIVREAAEQSGRGRVPVVHEPMGFETACRRAQEGKDEVLFFDTACLSSRPEHPKDIEKNCAAEGPLSHDLLSCRHSRLSTASGPSTPSDSGRDDNGVYARSIFIGPEGGWTDEERALAKEHVFATVSLGSRVLRAETAAILASHVALT